MDVMTTKMQDSGLSIRQLAEKTGMADSKIASFKSGKSQMGLKSAERIAGHLDAEPVELMISGRLKALNRAVKNGNRTVVLNTVKAIIGTVEKHVPDQATDEDLDRLVGFAMKLAVDHDRGGSYGS